MIQYLSRGKLSVTHPVTYESEWVIHDDYVAASLRIGELVRFNPLTEIFGFLDHNDKTYKIKIVMPQLFFVTDQKAVHIINCKTVK